MLKRQNITSVMKLLDQVENIRTCVKEIAKTSKQISCISKMQKRVGKLVHQSLMSTEIIKEMVTFMSDKRTVLAHRHMATEDARPPSTDLKGPSKSKRRSSDRHADSVKKHKFSTMHEQTLMSSFTDLHQAGRLVSPEDICKIIHGDDTPEHKKRRTTIMTILSGEKFEVASLGTL